MKIEQTSFFVGDTTWNATNEKNQNEKDMNQKSGSYFTGSMKQNSDPIAARREEAVNKAMKVVRNAFDGDKKVDEDLQLRTDHIRELHDNLAKAKDSIENINDSREAIKEMYGVAEDSKEQGDLELLEKRYRLQNKSTGEILTEQEQNRLQEIDQAGLTEYQSRSFELYKQEDTFKKEIDESLTEIQVENAVIRGVKLERLKTNPILEATQEADKIQNDASEEIKGMLVSEMKDHIDEVKKKQQEEAEKKEKAEEDAKRTETDQVRFKENDQLETIIKLPAKKNDIQTEIENIIDKMNLLGEDILGAVVDTNL
ncbi:MAG: hypothetical protein PHY47_20355 [Lachnospiraceae bacterium]|nr:hypothetical protein [Lachnospiraceae bacterium]